MENKKVNIVQNKDIYYLKNNSPNKKGVIIYVHGFTSSYYLHHEFVLANDLSEYDYFSMNFHEQEVEKDHRKLQDYDINNYANELIEKILYYDFKNIILIGHSMGGGISLLIYMKIASRIKKIILVNAINPAIYNSSIGLKYLFSVIKNEQWRIKSIETNEKFYEDNQKKFIIDEYLNYELEKFLLKKRKFMFLGVKLISPTLYIKLNKLYRTITIPVLFISGREDQIIPSRSTQKYLELTRNPHIKFIAIPNTKHIPFIENFDEYNKIVWKFILDKSNE